MLIDFEDVYYAGILQQRELGKRNHAPEINSIPCPQSVDIWAIGRLIWECKVPNEFQDVYTSTTVETPADRPTAGALLHLIYNINCWWLPKRNETDHEDGISLKTQQQSS